MSGEANMISQLMEITGLDKNTAENVLRINNYDLEQAINYHLENNCVSDYSNTMTTTSADEETICSNNMKSNNKQKTDKKAIVASDNSACLSSSTSTTTRIHAAGPSSISQDCDETTNIRAPIPSRREQLLLPEDDNFRYRKRRAPAFTVCPLRNFAREAELQEQQLAATAGSYLNSFNDHSTSNNDYSLTSSTSASTTRYYNDFSSLAKKSRLEDLFRPPTDLLFWGTFQAARDYATSRNRWLLVNLQDNSEFKSQILNRDIWPDPDLKELILKYFVFWQVSVDNPEGLRFKIFYHVDTMPYVCVIDPRTGENKFSCDVVTPQTFCSDLQDFLGQNSHSLDSSKTDTTLGGSPSSSSSSSCNKSETLTKKSLEFKTSELSEEDQLELAIRNSLRETTTATNDNGGDNNSLDGDITACYDDSTTQSDDINDTTGDTTNLDSSDHDNLVALLKEDEESSSLSQKNNYKQYLGDKNDPITKIQLRLPTGERDQLEWPSSTKLRAINYYVQSKYPDIAKEPYKIILSFPRQNILELDDNLTLQNANLHPSVILHLHPDD